jgi:hypothetical protein
MREQMRADFEKWAKEYEYNLRWSNEVGNYSEMIVRILWDTWQASRQSLVVKLPSISNIPVVGEYEQGYVNGESFTIDAVKRAIDTAGVRYE